VNKKISLLIPTRERPEGAIRAARSAYNLSRDLANVETLFYVAEDDPRLEDYDCKMLFTGPHIPTSHAWNYLYERCSGDLIMLGSDDIVFETLDWDTILLRAAIPFNSDPHVFHFLDSRHPSNTPHPIMTRSWCELIGWFVPPQFNHWYVDSFTCWVAKLAGVFSEVHDVQLTHAKQQASSSRFPWSARWHDADSAEWDRSVPRIEIAMSKVLRAIGR